MKNKLIGLLMAAVMAGSALLTGCGGSGGSQKSGSGEAAGDKFMLGGLAPLTGNVSVYGISTNNGIEMAVKEINEAGGINGQQIEYHVLDEKGDVTEATNAYGRLVSDYNIDALIGDVTSKPSIAVATRAAADGMPMITPTGTADPITKQGETVFRTCFTDHYQGTAMADYLKQQGVGSAAVLYDNGDDYSVALQEAFVSRAKENGITVTNEESFASKDTDFKAQLTKIAGNKPEVLFVPAYYETDALILRQLQAVGFTGTVAGGDGWDGILSQFKDDPKGADGVLFSNHYSLYDPDEKIKTFVTNYQEAYGEDPTAFSALGYDSVFLLKQAVEEAGSKDKAKVVDALGKVNFSGITGSFAFDEDRNPIKTVSYIRVTDGRYELEAKTEPESK